MADTPRLCITAAIASEDVTRATKWPSFTMKWKKCQDRKKKKSQTAVAWNFDIRLWAEKTPTSTASALMFSLLSTLRLQPVSGLLKVIKAATNVNIWKQHISLFCICMTWSLHLIETKCSRTPKIKRFNQKYLILLFKIVFFKNVYFLLLHLRIFLLIDERIVNFEICSPSNSDFNHSCLCPAQGTALTSCVSDPHRQLNSSPCSIPVWWTTAICHCQPRCPLYVSQQAVSHWNLWDLRLIANDKKKASLKR